MTKKTFVLILLMDLSGFNYLRYKFLKLRAFTTSDLQKVFSKDSISIAALGLSRSCTVSELSQFVGVFSNSMGCAIRHRLPGLA